MIGGHVFFVTLFAVSYTGMSVPDPQTLHKIVLFQIVFQTAIKYHFMQMRFAALQKERCFQTYIVLIHCVIQKLK